MKLESLNAAIELTRLSKVQAEMPANLFEHFAGLQFTTPGFLNYAVREGWLTAEQINFNGVPGFVMFWGVTMDHGLAINACQTLNQGVPIDVAFAAADLIRQREGLKFVRFASTRPGLLHCAEKFGFKFDTVVMVKG